MEHEYKSAGQLVSEPVSERASRDKLMSDMTESFISQKLFCSFIISIIIVSSIILMPATLPPFNHSLTKHNSQSIRCRFHFLFSVPNAIKANSNPDLNCTQFSSSAAAAASSCAVETPAGGAHRESLQKKQTERERTKTGRKSLIYVGLFVFVQDSDSWSCYCY